MSDIRVLWESPLLNNQRGSAVGQPPTPNQTTPGQPVQSNVQYEQPRHYNSLEEAVKNTQPGVTVINQDKPVRHVNIRQVQQQNNPDTERQEAIRKELHKNMVEKAQNFDLAHQHMPQQENWFVAPKVTDNTFERLVMEATRPVIVVFTIPSCSSCISLKNSALQALNYNFKDTWDIYEFVCGTDTKTDKDMDITGHPAMFFFNKGEEIGQYLGYSQYEYYASYIKSLKLSK